MAIATSLAPTDLPTTLAFHETTSRRSLFAPRSLSTVISDRADLVNPDLYAPSTFAWTEQFGWPFRAWQAQWMLPAYPDPLAGIFTDVELRGGIWPSISRSLCRPLRSVPVEPLPTGLLMNVIAYAAIFYICVAILRYAERAHRRYRIARSLCPQCKFIQHDESAGLCTECGCPLVATNSVLSWLRCIVWLCAAEILLLVAILTMQYGNQTRLPDLYRYSALGRADRVLAMCADGGNVDLPTPDCYHPDIPHIGMTPLMIAVHRRNYSVVEVLLDHGADPNTMSMEGLTPLIIALAHGNTRLAMQLLDAGADIHSSPRYSPLCIAAAAGQRECVLWLLTLGVSPDAIDRHGKTAILYGIEAQRPDDAQGVIESLCDAGADLNVQDPAGQTALMLWAARGDGLGVCELLIERGADINIVNTGSDVATALHASAVSNNIAVATLLVKHGADLSLRSRSGESAEEYAWRIGAKEVATVLRCSVIHGDGEQEKVP